MKILTALIITLIIVAFSCNDDCCKIDKPAKQTNEISINPDKDNRT